ncbi:uncharacterized protein LOC116288079 [Actinia tenebrosa]|uniref:Uncharacterized protein LOC116288079 n=1 Tax=Actinia tenebrosa TaxID=6105 RepID=A0A6P8H2Q6_ACTTE|nr:uncharacterized protein LOC116288079 [Actinia tenebrosa]
MVQILSFSAITLIFIATTGSQVVIGGTRASSHKETKVVGSKEDKVQQNSTNKLSQIFHPTPQESHFEAPVKKSFTSTRTFIRKILANKNHVRNRVKEPLVKRVLKQNGAKISKSDSGKGLEMTDDFLAGSVKQSNAIENALSFQKSEAVSAFREIPRPGEEKNKRTNPNGRATKSTIEILSEKTNPEKGTEVAKFRSETEDKMSEISFDGNDNQASLSNENSVFRRTMSKMIKEKEASSARQKRSFEELRGNKMNGGFYNDNQDAGATSLANSDLEEGWEVPGKRKHIKNDETTMLKHLLRQDTMAFGTLQEDKEEQSTIKEIEKLSRQSSSLPKNLHLPYMSGPLDDMGLDFSKMDVSVGKLDSSENNDFNEGGKGIFLKRDSVSATGGQHDWETRNRNQIPRHHIDKPGGQTIYAMDDTEEFEHVPKLTRFPSFYRAPEIRPIVMEGFHRLGRIPPIAAAIISREDLAPREPIPSREAEPEDEPPPVSEFIEADEPAPIPELPSLREIPPIPEIRDPEPKDLNPKDTFGNKG